MDLFDNLGSQPTFLFSMQGTVTPMSIVGFSAYEWMSHFYTVNLTVSTETDLEPSAIIDKEGVLTVIDTDIDAGRADRFFNGIVATFEQIGVCDDRAGISEERYIYELELVPTLWRLTLRKNCRIFQETTVQEIVEQILREAGITSDRYRLSLLDKDRQRGFCVQYRETDFDFISRLLEEEGIFYYFEQSKDKHVLVISDCKGMHPPINGQPSISFNSGAMVADNACINSFSFSSRMGAGAFTHRNFNFKRPSLDLTSGTAGAVKERSEIYDYPALHTTEARGSKLAKVRMEALGVQQAQGRGQSSCCRLTPGHTFTLTDHPFNRFNTQFLIVDAMHSGFQPQSLEERAAGGFFYECSFTVIPATVPFRPTVTVNKPVIPGLQTAMVVGPSGQEIYTDEYGRIKVRFHWDREGKSDGNSSCWLRISQPWSGARWGMIAIPRVGDEVLVAFLEGDPDRPVVVGTVNNADSPALYQLPAHQTQVGIRTRSTPNGGRDNFNELRFEDKKGSEHIYLQAERDWNILTKNDKGQMVGHDETLLVKNDRKKTVEMNQSESIGMNKTIRVGADHDEHIGADMRKSVGANKSETVGANSAESVGMAKEVTVGGLYQLSVGGVMNETVAGAKTEEVGMAKAVVVGADMTEHAAGNRKLSVGNHCEISAGESFRINCGKATLTMDSDGRIFLSGTRIDMAASGVMKATAADIKLN